MKKTILITGGTGDLGRCLAENLKKKYRVILGARNNTQNLLAKNQTGCETVPLDVTNINSIRDIVNEYKPNIIIHAAANKFVDLSQKFPFECLDVNVQGSSNIARVAIDKSVEIVVGISTDKASPPAANIYGMSKSMMEKLFCSCNKKSKTKFVCVRYGNVVWSAGSVLPIWKNMHNKDNTIYTTGPEMKRYFFTVHDACQLVITVIKNISKFQGKIISREMKSCKMIDIIKVWIKEYGGKYKIVNQRDGDAVVEYLIGENERHYTSEVKIGDIKHYVIDFSKKLKKPLSKSLSSGNAKKLSDTEIKDFIRIGMDE
jgi:FlaA1/EpsC-like NDP-sugar epimerase